MATCLAVFSHGALVLSGVVGFSLFSAPSDVNRSLTITLAPTVDEGLKASEDPAQETVNEVQRGEASAPKTISEEQQQEQHLQEIVPKLSQATEIPIKTQTAAAQPEPITPEFEQETQSEPIEDTQTTEQLASIEAAEAKPKTLATNDEELISAIAGEVKLKSPNTKPAVADLTQREQRFFERRLVSEIKKISRQNFDASTLEWQNFEWRHKGEDFIAKIEHRPAKSDLEMDELMVDVVTERDGEYLTTTLRLKQLAFSNFAQFVDNWDDGVSIHDDEFNGRFHSNTAINITSDRRGAPRFLAKMTTSARSLNYDGHVRRKQVFKEGLETGVKRIKMPKPKILFEQDTVIKTGTIRLEEDVRLIFQADGSVLWQALDSVQPMRRIPLNEQANYLVAAPGVKVHVKGEVNGLVAIYAPSRIVIEGPIHYVSRAPVAQGGDFLGLVSGRSILVADRKVIGPGDLHIDAALYAKNRFAVRNLRGRRAGTLSIFGSITSGSITATEPRYATRIDFDPRLENMRPPGFPVTDRYELVAENLQWQAVENSIYDEEDLQIDNAMVDLAENQEEEATEANQ